MLAGPFLSEVASYAGSMLIHPSPHRYTFFTFSDETILKHVECGKEP